MKKLLFNFLFLAGLGTMVHAQVSITPGSGNRGQSLPIIISAQSGNWSSQGSNLVVLSQGSYTLSSGTSTSGVIKNVSVRNSDTVTAEVNIPANAPLGMYDLFLHAGTSTIQQSAFSVDQGTASAISSSPSGSQPGDTINVQINIPGASFKAAAQQGISSAWLSLNGEIINSFTNIQVINSETFSARVVIPNTASQGLWDINVYTNLDIMYTRPAVFEIDNSFSIEEPSTAAEFNLFPNPGRDQLSLAYPAHANGRLGVEVFSMEGKQIFPSMRAAGDNKLTVDMTDFPEGVYIIQLMVENEVVSTRKWVKE